MFKKILNKLIYCIFIPVFFCIHKFFRIKFYLMQHDRIGGLAIINDIFLRRQQLDMIDLTYSYFFISGKKNIANQVLFKKFSEKMKIIKSAFLHAFFSKFERQCHKIGLLEGGGFSSTEYYEFVSAKPSIEFSEVEELQGRAMLKKMGINPDSDRFVCLFSRDAVYLNAVFPNKDWRYHDYRNLDIDQFIEAVKFIISQGIYVIRMGSIVEKPISYKHPKLIDYPYTNFRSEFMDIYLLSHCYFVLGTESGATDVPKIFDVPELIVNYSVIGQAPWGKNSLYIPIYIADEKTGNKLPFYECLKRGFDVCCDGHYISAQGLQYVCNSAEEILEATQEMYARVQGSFQYDAGDQQLMGEYFQQYWQHAYAHQVKTPISISFLRKNKHLFLQTINEAVG